MSKKKSVKRLEGVVQWSDRHDPYVDRVAESAIYKFSKDIKPSIHLHIGDNLDLSGISRWSVNNFVTQYEDKVIDSFISLGQHFNTLMKINPKARIVWILGNHDLRLEHFVEQHPSWRGICDDIIGLLQLYGGLNHPERIELIRLDDPEDDFKIGKMHFCHGFSACKHVAAKTVEEYDEPITFGHSHTMQMFTKQKRGQARAGYCIGNLLNREGRKYLKGSATRWVTGFAYMEYEPSTGQFTQHLLPIVDGRFFYGGKIYNGN